MSKFVVHAPANERLVVASLSELSDALQEFCPLKDRLLVSSFQRGGLDNVYLCPHFRCPFWKMGKPYLHGQCWFEDPDGVMEKTFIPEDFVKTQVRKRVQIAWQPRSYGGGGCLLFIVALLSVVLLLGGV